MYYLLKKATPLDSRTQCVADYRVIATFDTRIRAEANRGRWTHDCMVEANGRAELRQVLEAQTEVSA